MEGLMFAIVLEIPPVNVNVDPRQQRLTLVVEEPRILRYKSQDAIVIARKRHMLSAMPGEGDFARAHLREGDLVAFTVVVDWNMKAERFYHFRDFYVLRQRAWGFSLLSMRDLARKDNGTPILYDRMHGAVNEQPE